MLAIRMQRTGRKGHAEFRIIVQESRRTPTSGAVVAQLGHYNPHAKQTVLDKEKTGFYLEHGAQPSDSVVRLLQKEGVALPAWVKLAANKSRKTRHPEKLRKNQPAKPAAEATAAPEATDTTVSETTEASTEPAEVPAETEAVTTTAEPAEPVEASAEGPVAEDAPAEPTAEVSEAPADENKE